jgi:hypothetical protein
MLKRTSQGGKAASAPVYGWVCWVEFESMAHLCSSEGGAAAPTEEELTGGSDSAPSPKTLRSGERPQSSTPWPSSAVEWLAWQSAAALDFVQLSAFIEFLLAGPTFSYRDENSPSHFSLFRVRKNLILHTLGTSPACGYLVTKRPPWLKMTFM